MKWTWKRKSKNNEFKSLMDELLALSSYDMRSIQKRMEDIQRLDDKIKKHLHDTAYKATSNKYNLFIWFMWWSNLSNSLTHLYVDGFRWFRLTIICLAIPLLMVYYYLMMKNGKKRNELFIEAI